MMWYGTFKFESKYNNDLLQALFISKQLYSNKLDNENLIEIWNEVYEPTKYFVGASDDFSPVNIHLIIDKKFEHNNYDYSDLLNSKFLSYIRDSFKKNFLTTTKIIQRNPVGAQKVEIRFMGQRYIPDSEIFQKLTKFPQRIYPMSIDAMGIFGSKEAEYLLFNKYKKSWENFQGFSKRQ